MTHHSQGQSSSSNSAASSSAASSSAASSPSLTASDYDLVKLPECCQSAFSTGIESHLGQHVQQAHAGQCPIPNCLKLLSVHGNDSHNNIADHVLRAKDHCLTVYKFSCSRCPRLSRTPRELKNHMRVHAWKHQCTTTVNGQPCGETYFSYRELSQHKKLAHPGKFSCPGCSTKYAKQGHLENHLIKCLAPPISELNRIALATVYTNTPVPSLPLSTLDNSNPESPGSSLFASTLESNSYYSLENYRAMEDLLNDFQNDPTVNDFLETDVTDAVLVGSIFQSESLVEASVSDPSSPLFDPSQAASVNSSPIINDIQSATLVNSTPVLSFSLDFRSINGQSPTQLVSALNECPNTVFPPSALGGLVDEFPSISLEDKALDRLLQPDLSTGAAASTTITSAPMGATTDCNDLFGPSSVMCNTELEYNHQNVSLFNELPQNFIL
ncbi:UNVERIFIED_CONTAM: hypothetical protein HDU68_003199 [Siphonaria sp. JEL0065]|nr:hypothetical protein HDU68_003199 [Siphonaria sp. JEL0065]